MGYQLTTTLTDEWGGKIVRTWQESYYRDCLARLETYAKADRRQGFKTTFDDGNYVIQRRADQSVVYEIATTPEE